MKDEEKKELEQEYENLKLLASFHEAYGVPENEKEREALLDSLKEHYNAQKNISPHTIGEKIMLKLISATTAVGGCSPRRALRLSYCKNPCPYGNLQERGWRR